MTAASYSTNSTVFQFLQLVDLSHMTTAPFRKIIEKVWHHNSFVQSPQSFFGREDLASFKKPIPLETLEETV